MSPCGEGVERTPRRSRTGQGGGVIGLNFVFMPQISTVEMKMHLVFLEDSHSDSSASHPDTKVDKQNERARQPDAKSHE